MSSTYAAASKEGLANAEASNQEGVAGGGTEGSVSASPAIPASGGTSSPGRRSNGEGVPGATAAPGSLADLQSYDEMALSALVGVSVPTHFINEGARRNHGIRGSPASYESRGIMTGLVGARFEQRGEMEWKHMLITREQNTAANGYGPRAASPPAAATQ